MVVCVRELPPASLYCFEVAGDVELVGRRVVLVQGMKDQMPWNCGVQYFWWLGPDLFHVASMQRVSSGMIKPLTRAWTWWYLSGALESFF